MEITATLIMMLTVMMIDCVSVCVSVCVLDRGDNGHPDDDVDGDDY